MIGSADSNLPGSSAEPGNLTGSDMSNKPARARFSVSVLATMLGQYAVMQGVVAAAGLIRNKVVAVRLGPSAFGEIAQLTSVVASVATIVSFGMQVSVSRNVARADTHEERRAYLANANGLVLSLSLIATVIMFWLLTTGSLLSLIGLAPGSDTSLTAAVFIVSLPFLGVQTNYLATLQGLLDVKGLAIQRSIAVMIATAAAVPLIWTLGVLGAAISYLLLSVVLTVLLGNRCRALGYNPLAVAFDRARVKMLASFGIVSMVVGFAQAFSDTAIRASLIADFGTTVNGLLQAPLVLASTMQAILLGSIGTLSITTVSTAASGGETAETVDRLLTAVVPIASSALALLGLFGVPAIALLYSSEFVDGASLLPYILVTQLVMVAVWVIGAPLLAMGDRALWMALDLIWVALRLVVSLALIPNHGSLGVAVGMLVSVMVHLILAVTIVRWRYGLRITGDHWVRMAVGTALILALSVIGSIYTSAYIPIGAAIVVWLAYTAYHGRAILAQREASS
jgi:PST family polysaccharide transporter